MPRSQLFQIQPFTRYLTGNAISAIGFGMQFIASSWITLELTGKGSSVAWLMVAHALPGLLFSPFAGVLVDRLDQRKLAALTDFVRALVVLLVPLLYLSGHLQAWHLYLMEFLVALGDTLWRPATVAMVRKVVPSPLLLQANIYTRTAVQLGMILGAGVGGFVLAGASPMWAMVVNGISFLISAAFIGSIHFQDPRSTSSEKTPRIQLFADMQAGLAYIRQNPGLVLPYIIISMVWTTPQTLNTLSAVFAKDVLKVGTVGFGLIDAGWAVGSVVGSFLLSRLVHKLGRPRLMVLWLFLLASMVFLHGQSWSLVSAIITTVLMGFFVCINVVYQTHVQEETALEFQGRVQSTFNTLYSVLVLGIYVFMGYLGEHYGPRLAFTLQSLVIVVAGVLAVVRFGPEAFGRKAPRISEQQA
ncbi:MFS transporter [Deinococcus roseus]|uniref:MFS transporter n=1 Tax=Deinococcus roseus TaxID=392414 RepID=A0ABQ2D9U0_9DEIO|nr:MFS transporter [Deinococcus roseus]GGJ49915.1 MFS transporter [Deinococcus roseus]